MPTSARLEVANSLQITVKTVQSAGSMRRPQASFEAQPRIARLLAPKMGIGPYRKWLYHVAQITCPFFNCSWSLSAMSAINSEFVGLPFVFDTV